MNMLFGRSTVVLAMFAWPAGAFSVAVSAGFPVRFTWPLICRASFGANGSAAQLLAWNGLSGWADLPSAEEMVEVIADGEQLVGLRVNPARSIDTAIDLYCTGIAPTTLHNVVAAAVTWH